MRVLAVNAGSSSLKLSLVQDGTSLRRYDDLDTALADDAPDAIGYRVVHGGHRSAPEPINDTVRAELDALTNLAPLHQPAALRAIDRTRAAWPGLPQVACFDTAFHTTIPRPAPRQMSAWRFPAGRPGHGWVRRRRFPGRRMVFGLFLSGQVDVDVAKAVPSDAFGILSDIMRHRLTPLNGRSNGVEQPRHGEDQELCARRRELAVGQRAPLINKAHHRSELLDRTPIALGHGLPSLTAQVPPRRGTDWMPGGGRYRHHRCDASTTPSSKWEINAEVLAFLRG